MGKTVKIRHLEPASPPPPPNPTSPGPPLASPGQGLQLPVEPGSHEPGLQVADGLDGLHPLGGLGRGVGRAGRGVALVVHGHEVREEADRALPFLFFYFVVVGVLFFCGGRCFEGRRDARYEHTYIHTYPGRPIGGVRAGNLATLVGFRCGWTMRGRGAADRSTTGG